MNDLLERAVSVLEVAVPEPLLSAVLDRIGRLGGQRFKAELAAAKALADRWARLREDVLARLAEELGHELASSLVQAHMGHLPPEGWSLGQAYYALDLIPLGEEPEPDSPMVRTLFAWREGAWQREAAFGPRVCGLPGHPAEGPAYWIARNDLGNGRLCRDLATALTWAAGGDLSALESPEPAPF